MGGGEGGYAGGKDACDVLMSCGFVVMSCVSCVSHNAMRGVSEDAQLERNGAGRRWVCGR